MYAFRPTVTGFPSTCAVVVMLPPEEATSIVLPDFDGRRATGASIIRVETPFFSVMETFIIIYL
jgi:hypothetical protein